MSKHFAMKIIAESGSVKNIAHRGFSTLYPENTLRSFSKAIEAGCDMIELDVQLTVDGEIVVFHDFMLERTTDGTGELSRATITELRELDAGSWRGERFAGERIPTLREAIELTRGRVGLVIEIKARNGDSFKGMNERLCVELSRLLSRMGDRSGCVVASFSRACLGRMGALLPGWERALICFDMKRVNKAVRFGEGIIVFKEKVDASLVRRAHGEGLWICPWTVDDVDEMRRLTTLGVDAIASNDPAALNLSRKGAPTKSEPA